MEKKEENIYQIIFDQAPIGIYTINKDGAIDSFNPRMSEISGVKSANEVMGMNVFSMDSYKKVGLDKFFREGLNGKHFNTEVKYVSQIGKKETWRHYRGVPVFLSDSKTVDRLLLLVEDITKEKERIELLERQTQDLKKFQMAMDGTSEQIIISDVDGIVLYSNHATEKITGYSVKEIIGTKAGLLWGGHMDRSYYQKLWKTIKIDKQSFRAEINNKRKNGELYIAEIHISPINDEHGNPLYFVAIERDITKEKQIDKVKTEFVSLASHQLRTPLSTVNWYTEMLLAGVAGEFNKEQKNYLEEIYTGNQRMVKLVNALLNVTRMELGTFSVDHKPTDIVKLAQVAVKEQNLQITQKKIKLTSDFANGIPKINADPKLLYIVFQNLLSNAIKYNHDGGTIEFSILLDKEKRQIHIKVADTGYGIPKKQQDKIFTKLFRADNVQEIDTEGTGLGLYIVKSIIEQTEGMIRFESEENKGTTFFITLPTEDMKKKADTKALA